MESGSQVNIVIDREDVLAKLQDLLKCQDLSRYVL
jgi:ATP-dependent protease HslVU (ClpYQ) ATPase subunit